MAPKQRQPLHLALCNTKTPFIDFILVTDPGRQGASPSAKLFDVPFGYI